MVVIVIVAVLAAAAVPAYRAYVVKTKEGIARSYIYNIVNKINLYYSTHGAWPASLSDIGVTVNPSPSSIDDFANAYTTIVDYNDNTLNVAGFCNSYTLSAAIAGLTQDTFTPPNDVGVAISMQIQSAVLPGGYKTWCGYYYFDSSIDGMNPLLGDYVKNCVNQADAAAQSAMVADYIAEVTASGCPV